LVGGEVFLGRNDKEPSILYCYLTIDQLENIVGCYNKQMDSPFEILNYRYLQNIGETVRDLLSTIY